MPKPPYQNFIAHGLAAIVLVGMFVYSPNFGDFREDRRSPFAGDFLQEWIGGHIVLRHGAARLYDDELVKRLQHDEQLVGFSFDEDSHFLMVYPPSYYVLLSPLSLLPCRLAAWLFAAVMVSCLLAAASLMWKAAPGVQAASFAWLFLFALLFAPLIESLTSGQKGTFCLLILSGVFYLLKFDRPFLAGLVFGLMAFKPQLAFVIGLALLCKGQIRFSLGAVMTALTVALLCGAAGWDGCRQFLEQCLGASDYVHTSGYDLHKSHCLFGFLTLLSGGDANGLVKLSTIAMTLIVAFMLALSLRGQLKTASLTFDRQYSALVLGTLLLSPHLFTYDLTMLLLPMFLLAAESLRQGRNGNVLLGLLVCLFAFAGFSPDLARQTGLQFTTVIMFALLWSITPKPFGAIGWPARQSPVTAQ